jgi:rhomboid family protein
MVWTFLSRLARVKVTAAYAVVLIGVTTTLSALGPAVQGRVIEHASTNLHNLSHGHVATLLTSAFVVDAGPVYEWLPGLVCLLGLAELLWSSKYLVIAFAVGHIGATILVAVWLTTAVELAWLPAEVSRAADVGMSYGAVGVLGAFTCALERSWRPFWVGWSLATAVAAVATGEDFTYTGHAVALVLGMWVATRFGTPDRWTRTRMALLFVAAVFGYLVLTNEVPSPVIAAAAGAGGASLGAIVAVALSARAHRNSSALASIQSDRHDSGGSSSSSPGISHS